VFVSPPGSRSSTTAFWGASCSGTTGPSPASCRCTRSWSCRWPSGCWTARWATSARRRLSCPWSTLALLLEHVSTPTVNVPTWQPESWPCWRVINVISGVYIPIAFLPASDKRKESSRPKKKFLPADVRKMQDILSKNMYKIRQKVPPPAEEPSRGQTLLWPRWVRIKLIPFYVSRYFLPTEAYESLVTSQWCRAGASDSCSPWATSASWPPS